MTDFLIIVVLMLICGAAIRYIYKAKKSGAKCIGCASAKSCGGSCGLAGGSCSGYSNNGGSCPTEDKNDCI